MTTNNKGNLFYKIWHIKKIYLIETCIKILDICCFQTYIYERLDRR